MPAIETLYVVNHSHTDIGFTDHQDVCLRQHREYVDDALEPKKFEKSLRIHDHVQLADRVKKQRKITMTPEQKERLIEHLWEVAYADGELHPYEEHLVRKIADLLYVPHDAFIAAKLRAKHTRS